jgi:hypothetical protein
MSATSRRREIARVARSLAMCPMSENWMAIVPRPTRLPHVHGSAATLTTATIVQPRHTGGTRPSVHRHAGRRE